MPWALTTYVLHTTVLYAFSNALMDFILFLFKIKIEYTQHTTQMYLPTTVSSILSSSRAMATMTRTSWRDPRQRIIHECVAFHVDWGLDDDGSGLVAAPPGPPGSVDCIFVPLIHCKEIKNRKRTCFSKIAEWKEIYYYNTMYILIVAEMHRRKGHRVKRKSETTIRTSLCFHFAWLLNTFMFLFHPGCTDTHNKKYIYSQINQSNVHHFLGS